MSFSLLSDDFIHSLIVRIDSDNVTGIMCTGSYARGQAGPYSDVDLHVYVLTLPESTYGLNHWDGYLVSLSFETVENERARLSRPEQAIWVAPGLRQASILLDKDGSLAKLQHAALVLDWADLQPSADKFALDELSGLAEEAHKVLNGLTRGHESTVLYAVTGLFLGLARALAVQRGLLIETENRYFEIIMLTTGQDHPWTRAFRLALGADISPEPIPPYKIRGRAALALYRETAALFQPITTKFNWDVINTTLKLIESAGY